MGGGKLNFYVEGTLSMHFHVGNFCCGGPGARVVPCSGPSERPSQVEVECPSIRLAQGGKHDDVFFPVNPWWLASRSCSWHQHRGFICECKNGAQVLFSDTSPSESDHMFDVELIRKPDAIVAMQQ